MHKAYERAVFNVLFHNRDDHAKNFAFLLDRDRRWRLAPCYDLTFSAGPGGEHQMDVCGEGRNVTRQNLLTLAQQADLDTGWAETVIDRMLDQTHQFEALRKGFALRKSTVAAVVEAIEGNARNLAR